MHRISRRVAWACKEFDCGGSLKKMSRAQELLRASWRSGFSIRRLQVRDRTGIERFSRDV